MLLIQHFGAVWSSLATFDCCGLKRCGSDCAVTPIYISNLRKLRQSWCRHTSVHTHRSAHTTVHTLHCTHTAVHTYHSAHRSGTPLLLLFSALIWIPTHSGPIKLIMPQILNCHLIERLLQDWLKNLFAPNFPGKGHCSHLQMWASINQKWWQRAGICERGTGRGGAQPPLPLFPRKILWSKYLSEIFSGVGLLQLPH